VSRHIAINVRVYCYLLHTIDTAIHPISVLHICFISRQRHQHIRVACEVTSNWYESRRQPWRCYKHKCPGKRKRRKW